MEEKYNSFAAETENLKYMWDRLPQKHLISYIKKDLSQPQPFFTRKLILDFLVSAFPDLYVGLEERLISPLVNLYWKNFKWIKAHTPFIRSWFCNFISLVGLIKMARLKSKEIKKLSILDIGCGSGNYYEVLKTSRLHRFFNYLGMDIAEKNIKNCQLLYPEADFLLGNILSLGFSDNEFDVVMVNSVFEHLSLEVLPKAIEETLRVARKIVIINFFNEKDIPDHIVTKIDRYHWNCLSRQKLVQLIDGGQTEITITDIYPGFKERLDYKNSQGRPISRATMLIKKNSNNKNVD